MFRLPDSKKNLEFPSGQPLVSSPATKLQLTVGTQKWLDVKRHPWKVEWMYQMSCGNSFFLIFNYGNPIFGQIFGHHGAKIDSRNKKINKVKRLTP